MKKTTIILFVMLLFVQCDNGDCVKSTGPMVSKTFPDLDFDKIIVHTGIALVLKQGENTSVTVVSGENLIHDIEVTIADGLLTLTDKTSCNWVRDYGQTTIYITAPNITKIYSKTEQNIISDGILTYEQLHLFALDSGDGFDGAGTGNFVLQIDNSYVSVEANNVAQFHLSGRTGQLSANFYSGDGILKAQNLEADTVSIFHRGTNDMFVYPLKKISGDIYNLGNVYAGFRPEVDEVVEHYRGKLIYN